MAQLLETPLPVDDGSSRKGLIRAGSTPLHRLDGPLWVEVVDAGSMDTRAADWDDLSANACDPNVFYERWFLGPAIRTFAARQKVSLVLVYRGSSRKDVAPGLVGLFPVEFESRRRLLSRSLRLFGNSYTFLQTPLIREGHAVETWEAFLSWADQNSGCDVIDLPQIRAEGGVARALAEVTYRRRNPQFISSVHARAVLRRSPSAEENIAAALTSKQRHEYSRQTRRLTEQGPIDFRTISSKEDVTSWVESFLDLEARGWKGEAGTALREDQNSREFFRQVVSAAADREKLHALGLWQNGSPIALKVNFLASPGSFAFKIAYDESFSRYSPGVLLELENIRSFHDRTDCAWMDSCASPNHPMINRIWRDRVLIQHVLLSTGSMRGNLAIGFRPLGRVLRQSLKRTPSATPSSSSATNRP